jgi:enamine deaminase RidA (YjgF/YER057c/UK114 family)
MRKLDVRLFGLKIMSEKTNSIKRLNPETLPKSPQFSQVIEVRGGRTVYVSGQIPMNQDGKLVGQNDFPQQAKQVFKNLENALRAVDLDFTNIVKITSFVADMKYLEEYRAVRLELLPSNVMPTSTTVEARSIHPDILLEVEVIAVADE